MNLEWTIKHNHIILENVSNTVCMMYQTMINVYILVNDLIPFKVDLVGRNYNNNNKKNVELLAPSSTKCSIFL